MNQSWNATPRQAQNSPKALYNVVFGPKTLEIRVLRALGTVFCCSQDCRIVLQVGQRSGEPPSIPHWASGQSEGRLCRGMVQRDFRSFLLYTVHRSGSFRERTGRGRVNGHLVLVTSGNPVGRNAMLLFKAIRSQGTCCQKSQDHQIATRFTRDLLQDRAH